MVLLLQGGKTPSDQKLVCRCVFLVFTWDACRAIPITHQEGCCISFLFSEYNSWKVLLFHSRSVGEVNDNFLNKYEVNPCLDKYNMEHDLLMSHICVMVLKFKPIQGLMRRRQ